MNFCTVILLDLKEYAKMNKSEINIFIDEIKHIGDVWASADVPANEGCSFEALNGIWKSLSG